MDRADFLAQVMESGERGSYKFTGGDGSRTEITGEVDFGAISFDKSLTIQNAAFDSAVKLSNRKFIDSVAFESCAFKEPIHLDKTSFKNGLKFKDCIFGAANDDLTRSMIVLDDASIRGDLVFDHVVVYGCLAARRLDLSGDIQFASCIVTADATNNDAAFNASDSKIRGSVIFETGKQSGASRDNPSVGINRSVFSDTRKSGAISVLLRGAKVTDMVNLAWARFEGELNLGFVSCRSLESDAKILVRPADVIGEQSKKARKYPGATITGALVLSGGEFGLIHLFGIYIGGEIRLIAGKSGQISIDDALCKIGNKEQFITPSLIEHFVMSRWHCSDFLFLHASIAGERIFSSARGISIKSSVIDRAVSFWPGHNVERRLERYLLSEKSTEPDKFFTDDEDEHGGAGNNRTCPDLLNRWHRRLSVNGNITIDHCTIGDDVIMTGVDVHSKDPADGRIEIVDSKVNGNVVFRSLTSFLADAEVQAPLLWLLAQRLAVGDTVQRTAFSIVASCHVLDMHGLEANNIDLTGLSIQETLGPIAPLSCSAHR